MGGCSCRGKNIENTEIEVNNNNVPKINSQNGKLVRIKSLRMKEDQNNIQTYEKPEDINVTEITKKKDDSIVIDYELNEFELNIIQQSLSKHFIFKDMDDNLM
jgi:hypothetical protein